MIGPRGRIVESRRPAAAPGLMTVLAEWAMVLDWSALMGPRLLCLCCREETAIQCS